MTSTVDQIDAEPRAYRFARCRVDLKRRQLFVDDAATAVSSRAYDVLICLIERRTRVVTKEELLQFAWPRGFVEENNLNQAISALRRALGDRRDAPQFITTIPGRGYRFVGDVEIDYERTPEVVAASRGTASPAAPLYSNAPHSTPAATVAGVAPDSARNGVLPSRRRVLVGIAASAIVAIAGGVAWWRRAVPPADIRRTVAVLPFQPLIDSGRNEALELGMAETLINRLSGLPGVAVAPFSSVRGYAALGQDPLAAGRALGTAVVLEGHIQMADDGVRLTVRLLDVGTGASIWADRFDEPAHNVFAMQDTVAQHVVDALEVELSRASQRRLNHRDTDNVEAWQLYLTGRLHSGMRNAEGLHRAIEYYEAAASLDPAFAMPAAGLAEAWGVLGVFDMLPPKEAFARARAEAERAIRLDPELAQAHGALGHVLVQGDRDWHGGDRLYRRALELQPAYGQAEMWLANNLCFQGRLHEAREHAERAQGLEPASVVFAANVGMIQYFAGDYAAARDRLVPLVEAAPGSALARRHLVRALLALDRPSEALALLDGHANEPAPGAQSDLGRALAADAKGDVARAEITRIDALGAKGFGVGYDLALIQMALGEHDLALTALERGVGDGSQLIGFLNVEPSFAPIRADPRFRAVSKAIGLG